MSSKNTAKIAVKNPLLSTGYEACRSNFRANPKIFGYFDGFTRNFRSKTVKLQTMKWIQSVLMVALFMVAGSAYAFEWGEDGVEIDSPRNGATVSQTFKVKMDVDGMKVHKAGDIVKGTGHFHLIIDDHCVKKGEVVAHDTTHKHFGKGQTETKLKLAPGDHTLALQFANGHHESYGKNWCKTIHVIVK